MNIKPLLFAPTAIALSLACLPVSPVAAQNEGAPARVEMQRGMNKLNLTEDQKTQMKQLREETKAQIDQILTTEQRTQMQTLKQSAGKMRGGLREGMKALNLSETQKQQIRQIKENAQRKMQAILTDDQRSLLQQQRQGRQEQRQQLRPQPVPTQPQ